MVIVSMTGMTIGQLWRVLKRLKVSAIVSMVTLVGALIGGSFALGRATQQTHTAVQLQTPFSMRIQVQGASTDFDRLILLKDPLNLAPTPDTEVLDIREVRDEFDVVPIGQVVAQAQHADVSWPWSMFALKFGATNAYADAGSFDLGPHKGDFAYTEAFVDTDTIHRTYKDGCVLEYRVTKSRSSDPATFKWIKNQHQ